MKAGRRNGWTVEKVAKYKDCVTPGNALENFEET